jgi:hypothetical protein
MPEQLLSRRGIIQKSPETSRAGSVPAAPPFEASSCALVLRYDTAARSVAVCLRLGWWICCLAAACCMHRCLFDEPDCLYMSVRLARRYHVADEATNCVHLLVCGHRETVEQEGRLVRARC